VDCLGYHTQDEIVKIVNNLIKQHETRDPYHIAGYLGIHILYRNFTKQRGAYKVVYRNRFIFLQNNMQPVTEQIVLWHEIGHDVLHRNEAVKAGGFKEFNIFDMRDNRMEYEANVFAAQASLPDETILEYIQRGYDIQQIARSMESDINLIALKVDTLISQGYPLNRQEHKNDFLGYRNEM
jgi:Zn-dependent peptidase ImmA (M78 family)